MTKPEETKGYKKLNESEQALFRAFFQNFADAWGTEARETLKPISVGVMKSGQLRFDYRIYGTKKWLHVNTPTEWY